MSVTQEESCWKLIDGPNAKANCTVIGLVYAYNIDDNHNNKLIYIAP